MFGTLTALAGLHVRPGVLTTSIESNKEEEEKKAEGRATSEKEKREGERESECESVSVRERLRVSARERSDRYYSMAATGLGYRCG